MKKSNFKILIYLSLLISGVITISCDKFLEVETVGRTTMPNFFSDVSGLKAGLVGTYSQMFNHYSDELYKYPDVAGDMVDLNLISDEVEMIDQFNFTSSPEQEVGAVGWIWRKILKTMANANNVLEYAPPLIEKFPNSKNEIELIQAQALFIRALCHFDLSRVYAQPYNYTPDASHLGVPVLLVTPGPDDLPARATVKEVYDQVIADLLNAEKLFGDTPFKDSFHISKTAVQALLARVYLYKGDWENSIVYATKVIDKTSLAFGEDYLAMYHDLIAGKEAIFRLDGTLKNKSLGTKFYSKENPIAIPADKLINLFDNQDDLRFKLFAKENELSANYITTKYTIMVTFGPETERYNPFILRVSEMYLIRSEAYLKTDQLAKSEDDLKEIVARALEVEKSSINLEYNGKDELFSLIKKERAKELSFEGHNFFDIVRYNDDLVRGASTTSNVKSLPYPNDLFVLPIPQKELDANENMLGNPTVND